MNLKKQAIKMSEGLKSFKLLASPDLVSELIAFIEIELPNWVYSSEFNALLVKKKNENQHSLAFCLYMTNKCRSDFCFVRENAQKGSSVIDIGVYKGANLIFTIEAKILPTPKGKKTRSEFEYVYGKGGGIQRFKDGNHGLDNNDDYLDDNGLLGFIKENEFEFWLEKVNQWIRDVNWESTEILEKQYFNAIGKLKSRHSRINGQEVSLHHFWVKVS